MELQQQQLAQIMQCLKRENRQLQQENFEFRQKISELDGDNKLLHQKLARHRASESLSNAIDLDSIDSNSTVEESADDILSQFEKLKDKVMLIFVFIYLHT